MRERDFHGYGGVSPTIDWGGGRNVAVALVLNYEEGAEESVLDGDGRSEGLLTDAGTSLLAEGRRDLAAESMFEFGSRVGVWRLLEMFDQYDVSATVSAAAKALERNELLAAHLRNSSHVVQAHGHRWSKQFEMDGDRERLEIASALTSLEKTLGYKPKGWMCRYGPSVSTRDILLEHDCIHYHSDSYADEIPFWDGGGKRPILVIPHSFANNDNKYAKGWFSGPEDYFCWHRAALDQLRREGAGAKLLTLSLHCRLSGHAARADGLRRFLDYAAQCGDVAFLTRDRIFEIWNDAYPAA